MSKEPISFAEHLKRMAKKEEGSMGSYDQINSETINSGLKKEIKIKFGELARSYGGEDLINELYKVFKDKLEELQMNEEESKQYLRDCIDVFLDERFGRI